jgi:Holliday junction resolvase RusA-like endonuclease
MTDAPPTVIIDGPAVAKGRPRMTRRGVTYTPAATRKYEAHGRRAAQLAMDGRPPISVPVKLTAVVDPPIPISWSGKRRAAAITGDTRPARRPDLDNFLKAALDAISGIVVADDSLIVEPVATKRYSIAPKMLLTVTPLTALPATRRAAS